MSAGKAVVVEVSNPHVKLHGIRQKLQDPNVSIPSNPVQVTAWSRHNMFVYEVRADGRQVVTAMNIKRMCWLTKSDERVGVYRIIFLTGCSIIYTD